MNDKYVNRLFDEWRRYGKIIVAVDYDDTISPWILQTKKDCLPVIELLQKVKQTGAYIVIFTSCNTDRYAEIIEYCISVGVTIDGINQNPISLPYGNISKIYYNILLDDRAGLDEATSILETAMYKMRGHLESEKNYPELG